MYTFTSIFSDVSKLQLFAVQFVGKPKDHIYQEIPTSIHSAYICRTSESGMFLLLVPFACIFPFKTLENDGGRFLCNNISEYNVYNFYSLLWFLNYSLHVAQQ